MDESCRVSIQPSSDGYIVRVTGRGTAKQSPAVRDFVCHAVESGADFVLDLSACEYLDSTFLGCLVILHERAERGDGSFAICCGSDCMEKLLHSMRLELVVPCVNELPEVAGPPVELPLDGIVSKESFGQHLLETHRRLAELGGPNAETFRGIADQLARELNAAED